jgi:hypothetical protein
VGGGQNNTAKGAGSTVGGGGLNTAQSTFEGYALVSGGYNNTASQDFAVVSGGAVNTADSLYATVAGGNNNYAGGNYASVGGGYFNGAVGDYSMIPGGYGNGTSGRASFAAGYNAAADYSDSFVWSDGSSSTFDTAANQFVARASGGFYFYTGSGDVGAQLTGGATSWTTLSDRNAKKNIVPVDCKAVLEKLAQVPIARWNYNWEKDNDTPNIGPMAQDFIGAFYPGRDDKHISTLQFDGVELAAIQGLNQKVDSETAALREELKRRDVENAELKHTLSELKQLIDTLNKEIMEK